MANLVFPRSVLFGEFEADLVAGELRKNGLPEKILLQEQPLAILRALVARPGEMVSREELFQLLWNGNTNVDFDPSLNKAINRLRISLGDSAEAPHYIETLSRRGYRFICPVVTEVPSGFPETADSTPVERKNLGALGQIKTWWKKILPAVTAGVALAAGTYFYFHRTPKLTDKDTIVLADFTNATGDPVFDGALRQGLAVQLEQSPFLSLISDERIEQTLRLMGQPVDAKLTPGISRELCQRIGATVVLDGFIAQIGTQYSLILKVVKCSNGESLTSTEAQANDKSQVLNALGKAASEIRKKLGESVSSIQKFDTPLEQATTSSFEALQAFSLGWKTFFEGEEAPAALLFQRAIRLDPSFAMAYALLGLSYANQGESLLAAEHIRKAFELRASVSEREKFFIETVYYDRVHGDTEKSRQVLEVWAQTYPRDWLPLEALGDTFHSLGEHEKALEEHLKALRLSPETVLIYSVIVYNRISLNQLREAHATIEDMKRKNLDSNHLCGTLYGLAFLEDDTAGMAQQVAWSTDKPGMEDYILGAEADTAAYYGQLRKARRFSDRAVTSAKRAKLNEAAAGYEASAALREAFLGNSAMSQHRVTSALELPTGRDLQYLSALSLAAAGDSVRAEALASDLGKRFPDDTIVQLMYLPILRAQLALSRNDAPKTIEALQTATTYELGEVSLSPAYIRGQAYLVTHQGNEAAAEFQKILDHRGIVLNAPIGALAHLGLGRAYVLEGDTSKAKAAYQDFLKLWKDADPDIPILVAAKAEYAKLK